MDDRTTARFLRIAIVRNRFEQGNISEELALDILSDCLSPGDESTRVDDIELLYLSLPELNERFGTGLTNE